MRSFWNAVGISSVPFVPFIGAAALYKSFYKILETIDVVWRIPGCRALVQKSKIRNLILQACFDATVMDRVGVQFLMAINIFGPLSAAQTAGVLLKMIAGITLLYERIFWESKDHPKRLMEQSVMESLIRDFQKSKDRVRMSSHLTATITTSNCYSKETCLNELQTAIDEGRSRRGKDFLRKQTVMGEE